MNNLHQLIDFRLKGNNTINGAIAESFGAFFQIYSSSKRLSSTISILVFDTSKIVN